MVAAINQRKFNAAFCTGKQSMFSQGFSLLPGFILLNHMLKLRASYMAAELRHCSTQEGADMEKQLLTSVRQQESDESLSSALLSITDLCCA